MQYKVPNISLELNLFNIKTGKCRLNEVKLSSILAIFAHQSTILVPIYRDHQINIYVASGKTYCIRYHRQHRSL